MVRSAVRRGWKVFDAEVWNELPHFPTQAPGLFFTCLGFYTPRCFGDMENINHTFYKSPLKHAIQVGHPDKSPLKHAIQIGHPDKSPLKHAIQVGHPASSCTAHYERQRVNTPFNSYKLFISVLITVY